MPISVPSSVLVSRRLEYAPTKFGSASEPSCHQWHLQGVHTADKSVPPFGVGKEKDASHAFVVSSR